MSQSNELLLVVAQIQLSQDEVSREVTYQEVDVPGKMFSTLKAEQPDNLLVVGDRVTMKYSPCDSNGRVIKVERNVEMHSGRTVWKEIWSQEPCRN